MADKNNELTEEGKKKLEERLKYLVEEAQPQNIEELRIARSQGDLSENADYDAAKNRQAEIQGEITDIQNKLNNYKVIEKDKTFKGVQIGSIVTVEYLTGSRKGNQQKFEIVGSGEINLDDLDCLKIEKNCPLGKALDKHNVGEELDIDTPDPLNSYKIKIVDIK